MSDEFPKISILIPTLNAVSVLENCLASVAIQKYPKECIEIIVADGGSTDKTLEIAGKYGAKVVPNPLKTGESGKMAALKVATGKYIALIDSDNILPDENWISQMITPLEKHPEAVGSEPLNYTWRAQDGFITRYCALVGMNDPFAYFLGNYDRLCLLSGLWTEIPHTEADFGDYIVVSFSNTEVPTIGANGTVFRTDFLKSHAAGDYLFDIDILASLAHDKGSLTFIKVKNGIIHSYCESDISKFARKQERRVKDFLFHKNKGDRRYNWSGNGVFSRMTLGYLKFIVSCLTIFPLIFQSVYGYSKKPDAAWFFHPLACEITLWQYAKEVIIGMFSKSEADRTLWKQ